jgi:hypothetical protein
MRDGDTESQSSRSLPFSSQEGIEYLVALEPVFVFEQQGGMLQKSLLARCRDVEHDATFR